jgi:hypothetical protein
MRIQSSGLLLKASDESFTDDKGEAVQWMDVSMVVDGEIVAGTGAPGLREGLNGSRKAFEEGQMGYGVPVTFSAHLRPEGKTGRRFKIRFDAVEAATA